MDVAPGGSALPLPLPSLLVRDGIISPLHGCSSLPPPTGVPPCPLQSVLHTAARVPPRNRSHFMPLPRSKPSKGFHIIDGKIQGPSSDLRARHHLPAIHPVTSPTRLLHLAPSAPVTPASLLSLELPGSAPTHWLASQDARPRCGLAAGRRQPRPIPGIRGSLLTRSHLRGITGSGVCRHRGVQVLRTVCASSTPHLPTQLGGL